MRCAKICSRNENYGNVGLQLFSTTIDKFSLNYGRFLVEPWIENLLKPM